MPANRTSNIEPRAVSKTPPARGPHGGRRSGAGAPKGNLNGLKHGLRSSQLKRFTEQLASDPAVQKFWSRYSKRMEQPGAPEAYAGIAAAALLRHTRGAGIPELQGALRPLSKKDLRRLARTLAGQAIKKSSARQIPNGRFYS
jgi:hypothetical protein